MPQVWQPISITSMFVFAVVVVVVVVVDVDVAPTIPSLSRLIESVSLEVCSGSTVAA